MRTTRGRAAGAGAVLGMCALLVAVVAGGEGEPPARFELHSGGAWVASSRVGLVTLIDGPSGQVAARVKVADGAADLAVAQWAGAGYAVERQGGSVARIDPTTFAVDPPVVVIEGASGRVSVHPTDGSLYVLDEDRGRVAVTDAGEPGALRRGPLSLAEPIGSSVVDGEGRLWLLGTSGNLTWFDGTERRDRPGVAEEPRSAELVAVDGLAALVERSGRRVSLLDGRGSLGERVCLEIDPADATVHFAGSAHRKRVYAVSGEDGLLRASDVAAGECDEVALALAEPGDALGRPHEVAGRVFVPNFTTGSVAVVDMDEGSVVQTPELVPPGTTFELFGKDGIAFYNDPNSERAGVVHLDGTFTAVAKYEPGNPGTGVEPSGGRDRAEGRDDQQAGRGPGSPTTTTPPGPDDPGDPGDPVEPDRPRSPGEPDRRAAPDGATSPEGSRPPRPDERRPPGSGGSGPGTSGPTPDPTPTSTSTTTTSSLPPDPVPPPGPDPVPPPDPDPVPPPDPDPAPPPDPDPVPPPDPDPAPPPGDTSAPVVGRPLVTGTTGSGSVPCRVGAVDCVVHVAATASDPESGIANVRLFAVVRWRCGDGVVFESFNEGTSGSPFLLGSTLQDSLSVDRRYGCLGPPGPAALLLAPRFTLESLIVEVFARATNGAGLRTDSLVAVRQLAQPECAPPNC